MPMLAEDKDLFRNCKGWQPFLATLSSLLDPYVAGPGKTSDVGALKRCEFMFKMGDSPQRMLWWGEGGLVAGDGWITQETR